MWSTNLASILNYSNLTFIRAPNGEVFGVFLTVYLKKMKKTLNCNKYGIFRKSLQKLYFTFHYVHDFKS